MIHLVDGIFAVQKAFKTGTLESDPTVYRGVVRNTALPSAAGKTTWSEFLRADSMDSQSVAVLLHGAFCDSRMYPDSFVDFLRGRGFHVLAIDHRGFGRSSWCRDYAENPFGVTDLARDALTVLKDVLEHECLGQPAHLLVVGHSIGGYVAQELLRLHSLRESGLGACTASAVLLCTAPWPEAAEVSYFQPKTVKFQQKFAAAMLPREKFFSWWRVMEAAEALGEVEKACADFPEMRRGSEFPETAEEVAADRKERVWRGAANVISPIALEVVQKPDPDMREPDSWSLVSRVFIGHGHDDQLFSPQAAEDLEAKWKQRSMELVVQGFPGQGHLLHPTEWRRLEKALAAAGLQA